MLFAQPKLKFIITLGFKDEDGQIMKDFDNFCQVTGLGLVIAGLIVELIHNLY